MRDLCSPSDNVHTEIPVETVVRISTFSAEPPKDNLVCFVADPVHNVITGPNNQIYTISRALPLNSAQGTVFREVAFPLVCNFCDGYDVSLVTLGQAKTGKTYTLYGPGLHFTTSEQDQGIVPRFIRETIGQLKTAKQHLRHWSLHLSWNAIDGDVIRDVLDGAGSEIRNVVDAFQLIQKGLSNLVGKYCHTLFVLTLEQESEVDSTVIHKVSTATFADLIDSEKPVQRDPLGRLQMVPTNIGLKSLQNCIIALTQQQPFSCQVPYEQSTLTMLLKSSFGGQAKTVLLCCISPFYQDYPETVFTLDIGFRAQYITNFVKVNSFAMNKLDVFGMQFATSQLQKLVTNAEELFQLLLSAGYLKKSELERISEWLMLKQECEECLNNSLDCNRFLERIEEEGEIEESTEDGEEDEEEEEEEDEEEESLKTDAESNEDDKVQSRLKQYLSEFRDRTNNLEQRCQQAYIEIEINRLKNKNNTSVPFEDVKNTHTEIGQGDSGSERFREKLNSSDKEEPKVEVGSDGLSEGEKNDYYARTAKEDLKSSRALAVLKTSSSLDDSQSLLSGAELERYRDEIKKLRKTREVLVEQSSHYNRKSKHGTLVSEVDEKRLVQYVEAIQAIDLAIEYKNELLCGHYSNVRAIEGGDEPADVMLLDRLMHLDENEIRLLLYRYFQRLVELQLSTKKLEMQLTDYEKMNDMLTNRVHNLSLGLQKVRLEAEQRVVELQREHEDKIHLVLSRVMNDGRDDKRMAKLFGKETVPRPIADKTTTADVPSTANNKMDKSSFITKFTRIARRETGATRLQTAATSSKATITRQKNKIFIQQTKSNSQ